MKKPIPQRYLIVVYITIAVLLGIMVYLGLLLAAQYRYIAREQAVHGKRMQISNFRKHRTLTIGDVSLIESWMTFDYIATAFRIPVDFIRTALGITDPRFPRMTLHKYAKIYGLDEQNFTTDVIKVVGEFFIGTTTSAK